MYTSSKHIGLAKDNSGLPQIAGWSRDPNPKFGPWLSTFGSKTLLLGGITHIADGLSRCIRTMTGRFMPMMFIASGQTEWRSPRFHLTTGIKYSNSQAGLW